MAYDEKTCPTCGSVTVTEVCDNCGQPADDQAVNASKSGEEPRIICSTCQGIPITLAQLQPRPTATS